MGKAMRSWLLVPADEEGKLDKVAGLGADVVLLDLASVAESAKTGARAAAGAYLKAHPAPRDGLPGARRWVRINPIGSAHWREDLVATMQGVPDGIVLPRAEGAEQVALLASEIYEQEQASPAEFNSVRIVPQVGDTGSGALSIHELTRDVHPRVAGLSWDADALLAATGMRARAASPRGWPAPLSHVRAQIVLAARAAGLLALETGSNIIRDAEAFRAVADEARAAGFDAMIARHPAQVKPIGEAFAPVRAEIERAQAIVAAFEDQPEAQVVSVDRHCADRGELARAKALLESL